MSVLLCESRRKPHPGRQDSGNIRRFKLLRPACRPPNAIKHARVRTSAALFTDAEAFNHQVPVGEAAFKVCATGYTEEGSPVEYSEILYLADAYFYEMIL